MFGQVKDPFGIILSMTMNCRNMLTYILFQHSGSGLSSYNMLSKINISDMYYSILLI